MRNNYFILSTLTLLALLTSCNFNKSFTLSGEVANAESSFVIVQNHMNDSEDTLNIKDGSFKEVINIKDEQFVSLIIGKTNITLYAYPDDEISVKLNEQDLKSQNMENIVIEGSPASDLILKLNLSTEKMEMRQYLSLPPAEFDQLAQAYYNTEMALIDSFKQTQDKKKEFIDKISLYSKIGMIRDYDLYTLYHPRLAPADQTPIPESFSQKSEGIALDNYELYKEMPAYKYYVIEKHFSQVNKALEKSGLEPWSSAYFNQHFDEIMALNTFLEVKNELGKNLVSSYGRLDDSLKIIFENRYTDVISNIDDMKEFEASIKQMSALRPGNAAPGFAYPDIDGNILSSDDLRGKVIYIDIWATWCGPCIREIPFLKQLEEELHNEDIAIVSISVDTDKRAWETMVRDENLKGYQLYAREAWDSKIVNDYLITGIPRFIMIDKEGNLINHNATRPSNPQTKATLLEYASK